MRGDDLDRVPCLQFILGHTAVVNGQPIAKVYDDAKTSFACQRSAMEMYGYDGLILHGWANAGGAEFGGDIEYPYRKYTGAPMVTKNPVQNEDDAWDLRVPDDIASVGTIPVATSSRGFSTMRACRHDPDGLASHLGGFGLRRGTAHALAHQEARSRSPRPAGGHRLHPGRRPKSGCWSSAQSGSWPSTSASRRTGCTHRVSSRPSPSRT